MPRLSSLIHMLKEQIDSSAEDSFLNKTKEEKFRLRLIDAVFSPTVHLHRLDLKQLFGANGPTDGKDRQREVSSRKHLCTSKKKRFKKVSKEEKRAACEEDCDSDSSSDGSSDGSWLDFSLDSEDESDVKSKNTGRKKKHFICSVCGLKFPNRSNLRKHKRIHKGEKLFGCYICGKSFTQKRSQDAHMRIHEEEKPLG